MNVVIYSKPDCPFCTKAKDWFDRHGYTYTENVLYTDDQIMALLQKVPGARSVPQIYIEDKLVGTYDDLMKISDSLIKKTSGGLMEFSETYKPFYYPWAVDLTSRHEKSHWIEDEIDLSEDVADWKGNKMTNNEKEYITNILRLFTQSDVAVGQNYYDIFIPRFKNNEVRNMLGSFASREGIHQRAYALLNETLGLPDSEYHAFLEYKEMTDKVDFMMDNDSNTLTGTGLALAKMVFNEGVSLFASFVMLLNFQRFGKMKGMGKVVEWSIRDESMHVEGNAKLFKAFCAEHTRIVDDEFKAAIYAMAKKSVRLEDKFIDLAYEVGDMEGLGKEEVKEYIRYITDRRLLQLGLKPNFKVKENPLPWLEWVLNGADHTNFFEGRVTEYEVAGLNGSWHEAYDPPWENS
mgnify:CR=1 FL=1